MAFRDLDASPDGPVETCPKAVETAMERGALAD